MARKNLLHVIALCLAAVLCVAVGSSQLAEAAGKRLDCSNTYGGASLSTIDNICSALTDDKSFASAKETLQPVLKLETIETCACALINHELAWASLLTHENEILFLSIKQFVDQRDEKLIEEEKSGKKDVERPNRASNPLFQGVDGDRRYYWDRLDDILRNANGENDDEDVSIALRENFAKIYYDPLTFKAKFISTRMQQSQKLRTLVSDTCKNVLGKFAEKFAMYFDRLARLSENDKLFFSLTAYNEDLYKLRLNTRACLYLLEKGQLVI